MRLWLLLLPLFLIVSAPAMAAGIISPTDMRFGAAGSNVATLRAAGAGMGYNWGSLGTNSSEKQLLANGLDTYFSVGYAYEPGSMICPNGFNDECRLVYEACTDPVVNNLCPKTSFWANITSLIQAGYKGKVWAISNEPDLFTASSYIPPEEYAQWYYKHYQKIKSLDPSAAVMIGGLAFSDINRDIQIPISQWWIDRFRQRYKTLYGVFPTTDIWNIHIYPRVTDPNVAFQSAKNMVAIFENYLSTIGETTVPIWITETSLLWNDPPLLRDSNNALILDTAGFPIPIRKRTIDFTQNMQKISTQRQFTIAGKFKESSTNIPNWNLLACQRFAPQNNSSICIYSGTGVQNNIQVEVCSTVNGSCNFFLTHPIANRFGTWHHLAVVWDGALLHIYIDGVENATYSYTGPLYASNAPLELGTGFNGDLDSFMAFDRALSSSQITGLANNTLPAQMPYLAFLGPVYSDQDYKDEQQFLREFYDWIFTNHKAQRVFWFLMGGPSPISWQKTWNYRLWNIRSVLDSEAAESWQLNALGRAHYDYSVSHRDQTVPTVQYLSRSSNQMTVSASDANGITGYEWGYSNILGTPPATWQRKYSLASQFTISYSTYPPRGTSKYLFVRSIDAAGNSSNPIYSLAYAEGDINGDGLVNSTDLRSLLQNYLLGGLPDTNSDGKANAIDFGLIIKNLGP